ncbi:CHAT domain-containing protein [Amycolatopsis sp. lyj-109]|uniref:CHAT domain-containing protein n=1 Tax=Amycolatopsis sp. lyj-109 TaxID=2789287 RepID=UPI00397DD30D
MTPRSPPSGTADRLTAAAWYGGEPPPLPATRREVLSAAACFAAGATVLFGADATEANLAEAVRGRDVVHLTTHLVLDDEEPLFGGLVLAAPADDEDADLLQVFEMGRLPC